MFIYYSCFMICIKTLFTVKQILYISLLHNLDFDSHFLFAVLKSINIAISHWLLYVSIRISYYKQGTNTVL